MSQALTGKDVSRTAARLQQICAPVRESLARVDQILTAQIDDSDAELAARLKHSGLASGKRIRPAMLLLAGACIGDLKKTHVAAAAAIELVHTATLVHDDVLDGAEHRRHGTTMNFRWDNTTTILTGDIIFTRAFRVACESGNMEVIRKIAESSGRVCEGEIIQNGEVGNFEIDETAYLKIISLKTAELCKCACGVGATLSECDPAIVEKFESYGQDIGIAFQIIDDVLDIVGRPDRVGKTLGTDLSNRKATLPLIHCLRQIDSTRRTKLQKQLIVGSLGASDAEKLLAETDSISYAHTVARQYANSALKFANALADSAPAESLRHLAEFVIERTF